MFGCRGNGISGEFRKMDRAARKGILYDSMAGNRRRHGPSRRKGETMSKAKSSGLRLLLADPDAARRNRILSELQDVSVIEAASLSEAFDKAEAYEPNSVALAAELVGQPGLGMFLHLADVLSVELVVFGVRARDRTPKKYRNSLRFTDSGPDRGEGCILEALLQDAGPSMRGDAGAHGRGREETPAIVVLGASTGGVSALETVLTSFPRKCPPTFVVQHIRAGFINGMIARLNARCAPKVVAARDGMAVVSGQVYVAADTETHLVLQGRESIRCRLRQGPPRNGHRPSVDALFESAAMYGSSVAAGLLTGMGADGAAGMGAIRSAGGFTIAQDETTCVVYGMPRVAVENGAAHIVLPLDRVAAGLLGKTGIETSGRTETAR
jgi:two-component system chemotaxis response regulator CheB